MFGSKALKTDERFYEKERQQMKTLSAQMVVLVDRKTGVNYLCSCHSLSPDVIVPLLGPDGKPIVDEVSE